MSRWLASEEVTLGVPAVSDSLRIVRLLASGMASGVGLDIEAVNDVRIAVDELANAAVTAARSGAVLFLRFAVTDELRVEGSTACLPGTQAALDPLAAQIVRAVATAHSIAVDEGEVRFSVAFAFPPDRMPEGS